MFEGSVDDQSFLPVISIATNHKTGCKKTCIDNIISNQDPQNIAASGKFSTAMSSHSGIFQISVNIGVEEKNATEKIKIEYEYSQDNIQKFTENLDDALQQKIEGFDSFSEYIDKHKFGIAETSEIEQKFENFTKTFKTSIEDTCKLTRPRTTKRNKINNPWITMGIIKSITTNDNLYQSWVDSFKIHELGDDNLKIAHRNHQRTLRWIIKTAKSKHFAAKFEKNKGNKKKTWQIINEVRGKEKME